MRQLLIAALLVLSASARLSAQEPLSRIFKLEGHGYANYYFHPHHDPRRVTAVPDVVTPHIDWRSGTETAPVRVLAIAHQEWGRWPVELLQRFHIDLHTVYCHDRHHLGAPMVDHRGASLIAQHTPDVEARLLQAMNEPLDVIVSDMPYTTLTEPIRQRLAELLDAGVGYFGPTEGMDLSAYEEKTAEAADIIAAAVPLANLRLLGERFDSPAAAVGEVLRVWRSDHRGRVADASAYPRDGAAPDPDRLQLLDLPRMEWEAWCSLLGRAMLWAADRVEHGSKVNLPMEAPPRAILPLSLPITGRWRIWDADGRLRHEGGNVAVPRLPAGAYFFGWQPNSKGNYWQFGAFSITADVRVAEIALDEEYYPPHGQVAVAITLSATPPPGAKLRCQIIDNHGYSIYEQTMPAARQAHFRGELALSRHLYNYVNVELLDAAGAAIDESRRGFFITQPGPDRDDLSWFVWEGGASFHPRSRILMNAYTRLGAVGVLNRAVGAAAMNNLHSVLWAYLYKASVVDEHGIASPCLANTSYRNSQEAEVRAKAAEAAPLSPLFLYLGDDVRHFPPGQEGGYSEHCRRFFADWARREYGDIAAVNAAWGADYASFDDVTAIRAAEARQAAQAGNFGPLCHYIDLHRCLDYLVADWWTRLDEVVQEAAPGVPANIGSSVVGWTWPGGSFDFWQLAENKNLVFQYPNPWVHDIFRSAAAPDAFHGVWYGGYSLYDYHPYYDQSFLPWWSVFRGSNLHGQYYGGHSSAWFAERLLGADLGPVKGFERILEEFEELQSGVAKLLFNAERIDDGIAIVYAPECLHATTLFNEGLPKLSAWDGQMTGSNDFIYMQSFEGLTSLLADMGFSYRVIPSRDLDNGAFLDDNLRCVVLPHHLRVTDRQAENLQRFVSQGGTVLADALVGMLNQQASPDHRGMLADLFGVSYTPGLPHEHIVMTNVFNAAGDTLGEFAVRTDTQAAGATVMAHAADDIPAITVNTHGQGRAILLNLLVRDYQMYRALAAELPFRDTIAGILGDEARLAAPITCEVRARGEEGWHHLQAAEINRYRLDGVEYVAFLRHWKLRPDDVVPIADLRPKPVWVNLPAEAHVYDVRRGMYRGFSRRIEDVFYPARAEVYALLPYEVRDLHLAASAASPWLEVTARIATSDDAAAAAHVFRLEITDPSGQMRRELAQNIVAPRGRLQERIFLGYNVEPGTWRVTIRDVATGMTRQAALDF